MRPMAFRLEHRIGVAAPAPVIWDLIVDLPGWSRWNPLYPEAKGVLGFGETLTLELALPGRPRETIRPVVADWSPGNLLHWNLKRLGGMLRTTRYIEIETLTETGCIFSNGEIFEGLASRYLPGALRRSVRQGFGELGEAVKREAEARFARAA